MTRRHTGLNVTHLHDRKTCPRPRRTAAFTNSPRRHYLGSSPAERRKALTMQFRTLLLVLLFHAQSTCLVGSSRIIRGGDTAVRLAAFLVIFLRTDRRDARPDSHKTIRFFAGRCGVCRSPTSLAHTWIGFHWVDQEYSLQYLPVVSDRVRGGLLAAGRLHGATCTQDSLGYF
jgi:hypothetical protein